VFTIKYQVDTFNKYFQTKLIMCLWNSIPMKRLYKAPNL